MSRLFDDASSEYLEIGSAVVTAEPLTLACWGYINDVAAVTTLLSIYSNAGTNHWFMLDMAGSVAGDPVRAAKFNGSTFSASSYNSSLSVNTWNHFGAVFSSTTSRTAYYNGSAATTDTTSVGSITTNRTGIGSLYQASRGNYMSGRIAEAGIWNVALTAAEMSSLARGVSPALIRPGNMVFYAPLVRDLIDLRGGRAFTTSGTIVADHPRIYLPRRRSIIGVPSAAAASDGAGASSGVGSASGVGASIAAAAGAASGVATVTGVASGGNQIVSTELGAAGRYINLGSPSALDNLGSQTVLVYHRPTSGGGENGLGYLYAKCTSAGQDGQRYIVFHNSNDPRMTFGSDSSGTALQPSATTVTGKVTYGSWQHDAVTWDGGLNYSGMLHYTGIGVDLALVSNDAGNSANGTTAIDSDASSNCFLMNRDGLNRAYVGDLAYIAVWDRVLDLTDLTTAQNDGPLSVPSGLVLLFANGSDLGPNAISVVDRSTHVDGALPPNTNLGGNDGVGAAAGVGAASGVGASIAAAAGSAAGVGAASAQSESGSVGAADGVGAASGVGASIAAAVGSAAGVGAAAAVQAPHLIEVDFSRSSVNPSGSSVSGYGDSATISLNPKLQESEVVSSQTRWLCPVARVTEVGGYRPTFKFLNYGSGDGKYHGNPPGWQTGRRPYFAYSLDGPWTTFDTNVTVGATEITFRHSTAFTQSPVYIAWQRTRTVAATGTWISALESTYPSLIHNAPSNTSGFESGTFASQTDSLGNTIAAQPFYAFKISDSSLTPSDGSPKRTAVFLGGVHAGEDQGDLTLEAAVDFLLSSDAKAQNVRRYFDVFVYPLINAPGRAGGGWRGQFTQGTGGADDANRHATDGNEAGLEIVTVPKAAFATDLPYVVQFTVDFHGDFGFHGLSKQFAIFTNTSPQSTAFFDAMETYLTTGNLHDYGTSSAESFPKLFFESYESQHRYTFEIGEPTPLSDANLAAGGEAVIKSISDLLDSGDIEGLHIGAASGTGTASGVGASIAAAVGSAAGVGTASGVGSQPGDGVGDAAGVGTASGVGASTAAADGASSGVGSAAGVGASIHAATGSAAGVGAASGISDSGAGVGAAAGIATVTGVAAAISAAIAAASGTAGVSAIGASIAAAMGSASGVGAASAVGQDAGNTEGAGSSAGIGSASGVGASIHAAAGSAGGVGTASGVGDIAASETVGSASGVGSAAGVGASIAAAMGSAPGAGDSLAIGRATWAALGSAAGVSTVSGVGTSDAVRIPVTLSTLTSRRRPITTGRGERPTHDGS